LLSICSATQASSSSSLLTSLWSSERIGLKLPVMIPPLHLGSCRVPASICIRRSTSARQLHAEDAVTGPPKETDPKLTERSAKKGKMSRSTRIEVQTGTEWRFLKDVARQTHRSLTVLCMTNFARRVSAC